MIKEQLNDIFENKTIEEINTFLRLLTREQRDSLILQIKKYNKKYTQTGRQRATKF